MLVPSLRLLSLISPSLPLFLSLSASLPPLAISSSLTLTLAFFHSLSLSLSLAYISIAPIAGLGKKGLHEQALCHSGRVHQRAECTG